MGDGEEDGLQCRFRFPVTLCRICQCQEYGYDRTGFNIRTMHESKVRFSVTDLSDQSDVLGCLAQCTYVAKSFCSCNVMMKSTLYNVSF